MIESLYFLYQYLVNEPDDVETSDLEQILKDFELLLDKEKTKSETEAELNERTTISVEIDHSFPWKEDYTKDIVSLVSEYVEDLDVMLSNDD